MSARAASLILAVAPAVVPDPSVTRDIIDAFQSCGVATTARGRFLDHPVAVASPAGDEPDPHGSHGTARGCAR